MRLVKLVLACLLLLFLVPLVDAALTDGLQGYYRLDTSADDSSGNNNNGVVTGASAISAGKLNGAYSFDGNDKINLPLSYTQNFTWSAWFKYNSTGNFENIISVIRPSNSNWRIFIQKNDANNIAYGYDDNSEVATNAVTGVSTNTWYHVVLQKENENWRFYLNNQSLSNDTTASFDGSLITDNVTFGAYNLNTIHLTGFIDEVAVYNRAINRSEIAQLYNSGNVLDPTDSDTTAPYIVQGSYNVTSAFQNNLIWRTNTSQIVYTNDSTPSVSFNASEDSNATISLFQGNYTETIANDSNSKCATSGTTTHTCTLPTTQKLSVGLNTIYISLIDTVGNENATGVSTSGPLSIDLNSCVPDGASDHTFDCSDNCNISSSVNWNGNNIYWTGSGTWTMTSGTYSNYGSANNDGGSCKVTFNGGFLS